MNAIVCVSANWGIGKNNDLLFDFKEDLKHFKNVTDGKIVVMGYNTLLSLPSSKPLKNRTNIVLCEKDIEIENAQVVTSLPQLFDLLKTFDLNDVYVIGGASVYKQLLPYCSNVIVTKVNLTADADVFFENLDELKNFKISSTDQIDGEVYSGDVINYANTDVKPLKVTTDWDNKYIELCEKILEQGVRVKNRTGTDTIKIASHYFELDVNKEFPILTSKFVGWKSAFKEMMWIYQAQSNDVRWLKERNVKIWDEWMVDKNGYYNGKFFGPEYAYTIGTAYGYIVKHYGLIDRLINTLKTNPADRRMVISLWQEEFLQTAVLPSCVWNSMWDVTDGYLNITVTCRSNDVPLGLPFNVTQYAALLSLIAHVTDLKVGKMFYVIKDAHIYVNQIDGIKEQIETYKTLGGFVAPKLVIDKNIKNFYDFDNINLKNVYLDNYKSHKKIKMEVSV